MGTTEKLELLADYRRGWVDGAGFKPYADTEHNRHYESGYTDGRIAFRDAMRSVREYMGLMAENEIRLMEEEKAQP